MNYADKVFKILGVKPDEEFSLINASDSYIGQYKISNDLTVFCKDVRSGLWKHSELIRPLELILTGYYTIQKSHNNIDALSKCAIAYAQACGYNWLTQDRDGTVWAYINKPRKSPITMRWHRVIKDDEPLRIGLKIPFISWEDTEPYYIGEDGWFW